MCGVCDLHLGVRSSRKQEQTADIGDSAGAHQKGPKIIQNTPFPFSACASGPSSPSYPLLALSVSSIFKPYSGPSLHFQSTHSRPSNFSRRPVPAVTRYSGSTTTSTFSSARCEDATAAAISAGSF